MGTIEKIARCKWPTTANETMPQLKRHWLYEAGMFNRGMQDMVFRVAEDGITGADFEDGAIPESKFDADLQANVGLENGAVTTLKFANGALSADTPGRACMADLFLTTAKIGDMQVTAAKLDSGITVYGPPVGAMGFFAGEVAPTNWMECNGATVNIADEPALYAAIGTYWGSGGIGKFKLPDFRGYFARGWDHVAGNDPDRLSRTGGDHVGSTQESEVKAHTHEVMAYLTTSGVIGGSLQQFVNGPGNPSTFTSDATGGQESRPINKAVMICIFAGA